MISAGRCCCTPPPPTGTGPRIPNSDRRTLLAESARRSEFSCLLGAKPPGPRPAGCRPRTPARDRPWRASTLSSSWLGSSSSSFSSFWVGSNRRTGTTTKKRRQPRRGCRPLTRRFVLALLWLVAVKLVGTPVYRSVAASPHGGQVVHNCSVITHLGLDRR